MTVHQPNTTKIICSIVLLASGLVVTPIKAAPISYWSTNGFSQISNDDGVMSGGFVDPGWGGQAFDAEYLYYKLEGSTVFLGLQSGFDLIDGHQIYSSKSYWAGDLALSFDGDVTMSSTDPTVIANSYEFGIDFGLFTADYNSNTTDAMNASEDGLGAGLDTAGVYQVGNGQWNTNMVDSFEDNSSPFAMNQQWHGLGDDPYLASLVMNMAGLDGDSYYRVVAFDLNQLGLYSSNLAMDVHWTMSCGNDAINGHVDIASVPEPASLILMATGLFGLVGSRKIKPRA